MRLVLSTLAALFFTGKANDQLLYQNSQIMTNANESDSLVNYERGNNNPKDAFSSVQDITRIHDQSQVNSLDKLTPIPSKSSSKKQTSSLIGDPIMNTPLREVIEIYCEKLYGEVNQDMVHSFVMVLLEGGAFTPAELSENAPQRAKAHAETAQQIWNGVAEQQPEIQKLSTYAHQNIVGVSPEVIESILSISFPSKMDALTWLRSITQLRHLRSSFFSEGFKGDLKINIARWQQDDASLLAADTSIQSSWQHELYKHYSQLQLIKQVDYPESWLNQEGQVKSIVVHGVVSPYLDSRINFLKPVNPEQQVKVYYLTNPRGIFNYEHLAEILAATWFDNEELAPKIQSVLDKPEHKDCWLGNIAAVKQDILSTLGQENWPEGRGAWYNENKPEGNIYQLAVEAEGNKRQSLKDFPVIEDLIQYLFEKKKANNPAMFDNVAIQMVLTRVEGRVANTKDTMVHLKNSFPEALEHGAVFISDNVSHNILKQDLEAKKILGREKVLATIGAGSDLLDPKQARDAFAKIIFEHFNDVEQLLKTPEASARASVIHCSFYNAPKPSSSVSKNSVDEESNNTMACKDSHVKTI